MIVALALGLGLGFGLNNGGANASPVAAAATTSAVPSATVAPYTGVAPAVGATWEYALGYDLTSNVNASVKFFSTDLENTDQSVIQSLVKAGHFVACYFSAGSTEDYRDDTKNLPASVIGNVMKGWEDEKWLDTRSAAVRQVMTNRIATAKSKGCSGVDPDNIDGYAEDNDSGFPLTQDDGVNYINFMANEAHKQGLAIGLKNGGDIASRVVDNVQWEINEQCVAYNECNTLSVFITKKKPVFHVEYTATDSVTNPSAANVNKWCASGGQKSFSTIIKHNSLDKWTKYC